LGGTDALDGVGEIGATVLVNQFKERLTVTGGSLKVDPLKPLGRLNIVSVL
jgi:hypothetical protein